MRALQPADTCTTQFSRSQEPAHMFIGWELKAETESPKFIFIISLASSAFAVVGFGDVLKTSQRHCLDRKSVRLMNDWRPAGCRPGFQLRCCTLAHTSVRQRSRHPSPSHSIISILFLNLTLSLRCAPSRSLNHTSQQRRPLQESSYA